MQRSKKPTLIVTPGDPEGIGPEVFWKALKGSSVKRRATLLVIGAERALKKVGAKFTRLQNNDVASAIHKSATSFYLLPAPDGSPGFQSGWSIQKAVEWARALPSAAIVTGPISKERLNEAGFPYPGHTEFLAALCGTPDVTMMLANSLLRVSLVTTHLPLSRVSENIRFDAIERATLQTIEHLKKWWKTHRPKVAIAALNPHAGEGGLLGHEETQVIIPAIEEMKKRLKNQALLVGPLPADTLFANHKAASARDRFDAVICMYHDQGLIPVKLLDFPQTVNVTLGLPFVRTSVDHGVAFDLAGKNKANPSSMRAALELALKILEQK